MARTTSSNGRLDGAPVLGCALALAMMMGSVGAMTHVVGGSYGWQVPVESTFFEDWAKTRTFGVGDELLFPYSPGSNNVLAVKKEEFDHCTQNSPIEIYYMGPTTVNLTAPGDYYFITSFGKHCDYGQRLHITVVQAEGSSGAAIPSKPTRRLLAAPLSSRANAPAPSPASSAAAATTVGAAAVVSGIVASLVSLWM